MQKYNAVVGSKLPTHPDLYNDEEVLAAAPFFGTMLNVFNNSVGRPSAGTKSKYNEVSKEFWTAVHAVLSGNKSAKDSLKDLERKLKRIRGRSW